MKFHRKQESIVKRANRLVIAFAWIVLGTQAMPSILAAQETSGDAEVKTASTSDAAGSETDGEQAKPPAKPKWIALKEHWEKCEFGGDGEISIKDGLLTMDFGSPLTGVRWSGPFEGDTKKKESPKPADEETKSKATKTPVLPRDNYELRWECCRDRGVDFMCAMTFPVAEKSASLVMGGWGGGITGISSIDGSDASENNTTMFQAYDNDTWYKARVRVETTKITVWVDGTELFDHPRGDHGFDVRFEMDLCTPLGIANFESDSRIRKIQIRKLNASEIAKEESDDQ